MRIVGGRFRGVPLAAPRNHKVRPTSDRVREAVFNILAHGIAGFQLEGARVLDLFAGTGALGLEAVSRGAAYCLFIDDSADARALIRRNIEAMGLTGQTRLFRRDVARLGLPGTMARFDLLFADPPYGLGLGELALEKAAAGGWLKDSALCVIEERIDAGFTAPEGFALEDQRDYGTTSIRFLRHMPGHGASDECG
jgi:16S rRNA (guanine966-N2)-methyltransferase